MPQKKKKKKTSTKPKQNTAIQTEKKQPQKTVKPEATPVASDTPKMEAKKLNVGLISIIALGLVAAFVLGLLAQRFFFNEEEPSLPARYEDYDTTTLVNLKDLLEGNVSEQDFEHEFYVFVFEPDYLVCPSCETFEQNVKLLLDETALHSSIGGYVLNLSITENRAIIGNDFFLDGLSQPIAGAPALIKIVGDDVVEVTQGNAIHSKLLEYIPEVRNR